MALTSLDMHTLMLKQDLKLIAGSLTGNSIPVLNVRALPVLKCMTMTLQTNQLSLTPTKSPTSQVIRYAIDFECRVRAISKEYSQTGKPRLHLGPNPKELRAEVLKWF